MYLLFAHLLLDYPLQGDFVANKKKDNLLVMISHCLLWSLGCSAMLQHLGLYDEWKFLWLFGGHLVMDTTKCRWLCGWLCGCGGDQVCSLTGHDRKWRADPLGLPLWVDQLFHVFQIWMCLR